MTNVSSIANGARCCISAVGMLANLLILFIVARYPAMRTACNVYVANLAATDFAFCLLALIQSIVAIAEPPYKVWERYSGFSLTYVRSCDVSRVILIFLASTSIMLLTVIAVERHGAITNPLRSRQHSTVKHTGRTCAVVWMVAALTAVIDTIARNVVTNDWTFTSASLHSESCVILKLESSGASHPFFVMVLLFFLFIYVLPSCIIIPLYVRILVKVRQSRRLTMRDTRSDDQAFLMVFVVTVFFLVTWLPFHIISFLIHSIDPKTNNDIIGVHVALSFAVFNSVANPFLYALLGRNFRDQLKKMFCCKQNARLTIQATSATDHAIGQTQVTGGTGQTHATDGTRQAQATGGTGQTQATDGTRQAQATGGTGQTQAPDGTRQAQATGGTGQTQATGGTGQAQATDGTRQAQATGGTGQTQAPDGTRQAQTTGGTGQAKAIEEKSHVTGDARLAAFEMSQTTDEK
ncbi:SSTR2 [Branchiostoma lanceolatum]|uniref:SSTR2 protein n=1 Tax=Branchiostoma lanceolatum TaxID=7740 RepID=A0A8J9ZTF8_BRALA|nr:SSTR2 [Branchiostoma lanceolatum]